MSDYSATVCKVCENGDNGSQLLLCDGCDRGFHTFCIGLIGIPHGDWFCARCVNQGVHLRPRQDQLEEPEPEYKHVAYLRVSTKGQDNAEYGRVGLITQNNAVLNWALQMGHILYQTIVDVGSAFNTQKRGQTNLEKLVNSVKPNTVIVVFSASRFSRNLAQANMLLTTLHNKNCYVYSITENQRSDSLMFNELVKNAENESQNMSVRAMQVFQRIRDEEKVVKQQVQRIYNSKRDFNKTMQEINKKGLKKRNGKPISPQLVQRWLRETGQFKTFSNDMLSALNEAFPQVPTGPTIVMPPLMPLGIETEPVRETRDFGDVTADGLRLRKVRRMG